MPDPALIHPDVLVRLRRLLFVLAVAPLVLGVPVFAAVVFWGGQECRGARAIVAGHPPARIEAKIELVGPGGRTETIWDGRPPVEPTRVGFPTNNWEAHFRTTIINLESGEVTTYKRGYLSHSGGAYYFIVSESDVFFASTFSGYYHDSDYPDWVNKLFGSYYMLSDKLTCVI